jgi:uncharacterized membrane protein YobD (UPF0266 family)
MTPIVKVVVFFFIACFLLGVVYGDFQTAKTEPDPKRKGKLTKLGFVLVVAVIIIGVFILCI